MEKNAEYIIKIDKSKKDIMGGYPVLEKKDLIRCKNCKFAPDNPDGYLCKIHDLLPWISMDFYCADAQKKGTEDDNGQRLDDLDSGK